MRNLVLLVIGCALGALGATAVLRTLADRAAYARGVMQVMQHHYARLHDDLRARTCTSVDPVLEKAQLRALAEQIEPSVYADAIADAPFREYTQHLRDALAQLPDGASGCPVLVPVVARIGAACDECHRQYR